MLLCCLSKAAKHKTTYLELLKVGLVAFGLGQAVEGVRKRQQEPASTGVPMYMGREKQCKQNKANQYLPTSKLIQKKALLTASGLV
jgi:hypothetical protein